MCVFVIRFRVFIVPLQSIAFRGYVDVFFIHFTSKYFVNKNIKNQKLTTETWVSTTTNTHSENSKKSLRTLTKQIERAYNSLTSRLIHVYVYTHTKPCQIADHEAALAEISQPSGRRLRRRWQPAAGGGCGAR